MELAVTFAHLAGSLVCHQLAERSFFMDGRQLPVCARCTGLYMGGALGLVGWWAVRMFFGRRAIAPSRALLLVAVAAVPTFVTVLTAIAGVWDGSNLTRAWLAAPLGLAAGAVVAAVSTKDLR